MSAFLEFERLDLDEANWYEHLVELDPPGQILGCIRLLRDSHISKPVENAVLDTLVRQITSTAEGPFIYDGLMQWSIGMERETISPPIDGRGLFSQPLQPWTRNVELGGRLLQSEFLEDKIRALGGWSKVLSRLKAQGCEDAGTEIQQRITQLEHAQEALDSSQVFDCLLKLVSLFLQTLSFNAASAAIDEAESYVTTAESRILVDLARLNALVGASCRPTPITNFDAISTLLASMMPGVEQYFQKNAPRGYTAEVVQNICYVQAFCAAREGNSALAALSFYRAELLAASSQVVLSAHASSTYSGAALHASTKYALNFVARCIMPRRALAHVAIISAIASGLDKTIFNSRFVQAPVRNRLDSIALICRPGRGCEQSDVSVCTGETPGTVLEPRESEAKAQASDPTIVPSSLGDVVALLEQRQFAKAAICLVQAIVPAKVFDAKFVASLQELIVQAFETLARIQCRVYRKVLVRELAAQLGAEDDSAYQQFIRAFYQVIERGSIPGKLDATEGVYISDVDQVMPQVGAQLASSVAESIFSLSSRLAARTPRKQDVRESVLTQESVGNRVHPSIYGEAFREL